MNTEYDIFERLPSRALICHCHVQGLENAQRELAELSKTTKNECFALDLETKEVVARVNQMEAAEGI